MRAKFPTLYNRRLQDIIILMYKVRHGFKYYKVFRTYSSVKVPDIGLGTVILCCHGSIRFVMENTQSNS